MKLAAIIISWDDDIKMLETCVEKLPAAIDGLIIISSETSNFGEKARKWKLASWRGTHFYIEPDLKKIPRDNETAKRNFGLDKARELGFTHFLMMDADEFYDPAEFYKESERFKNDNLLGLVCRTKVYFRLPTLTIGYDTTLVPFIHKITPKLRFIWNEQYPFAWTATDGVPFTQNKKIRIDPTRQMNIASGVEWSEITMHHYSYIRSDLRKKVRNSTARYNLEKSTIFQDYLEAKEGYYCKFYGKTLESCQNLFGVPNIIDEGLLTPSITK